MPRPIATAAALAVLLATAPANAAKPRLVTMHVVDANGDPVSNAWVRVPGTEGRRQVEPETGVWESSLLYRYDGSPYYFTKGVVVEFTVSAPGYAAQALQYKVHARKNVLVVQLEEMAQKEILTDDNDTELIINWFRRTNDDDSE